MTMAQYSEQTWCKLLVLMTIQERVKAEKVIFCERGWDWHESSLIIIMKELEQALISGEHFHATGEVADMLAFVCQFARQA